MLIETLSLSLPVLYDLGKTLIGAGGVMVSIYKLVQWVKDIREKDLKEMKDGITAMQLGLDKQTDALVNEFKEQRQDFRTFYGPLLQAVAQPTMSGPRAKRSPRPKARKAKSSRKKQLTK